MEGADHLWRVDLGVLKMAKDFLQWCLLSIILFPNYQSLLPQYLFDITVKLYSTF